MVHIGCGADVIRQRRRAEQEKRDNEAKGIYTIPPDFKPSKNKKYQYYTPLRKANIFSERQQLSFIRKRVIYHTEQRSLSEEVSPRPLRSYERRISSSPIRTGVSPWRRRILSSIIKGNSYSISDSSSISSNQSPAKPTVKVKGQLTRQVAFDELTSLPPSFSGQSSLSDDFMVVPAAAIAKDAKAKRKTFVKSNKKVTTATIITADVHPLPSNVIPEKDNDDDDPWLIYDLNSYLETEALDLAFMEDLYEIEDFLKCFHMASASI